MTSPSPSEPTETPEALSLDRIRFMVSSNSVPGTPQTYRVLSALLKHIGGLQEELANQRQLPAPSPELQRAREAKEKLIEEIVEKHWDDCYNNRSPKFNYKDYFRAALLELSTHYEAREAQLRAARPLSDWHEEYGCVLWWSFPIEEPPYVGCPLSEDWPGGLTHWTPISEPATPAPQTPEQD
jgi:hypothetical protein